MEIYHAPHQPRAALPVRADEATGSISLNDAQRYNEVHRHRDKRCLLTSIFHHRNAGSLTKRRQMQPAIFCQLHWSRFEKGKCEFSSSDPAGDVLGTCRQFNVPEWIKSGIRIRGRSYLTITAPTRFARHKSLRLWPFEMLKGVLRDREFNSSDETEKVVTKVWEEPTLDEV
jgi:hypothetical protein